MKSTPLRVAMAFVLCCLPTVLGASPQTEEYLLHRAAEKHDTDTVIKLLAQGMDANTRDDQGRSALHWAAGGSLLNRITQFESASLIEWVDIGGPTNEEDKQPLETLTTLLSKGADINAQDNEGRTPLYIAAMFRSPSVVQTLLKHNANVELHGNGFRSPLHAASSTGRVDNMNILMEVPVGPTSGPISADIFPPDILSAIVMIPEKETVTSVHIRKAKEVIHDTFDFRGMAKQILGNEWKGLSPPEKREFTELMEQLITRSYLDKLESMVGGKRFVSAYERRDARFRVPGKVVINKSNFNFPFEVEINSSTGQHLITEVRWDGVGMTYNYRGQIRKILKEKTYNELRDILRKKVDRIRSE